jgi:hypothetical protein
VAVAVGVDVGVVVGVAVGVAVAVGIGLGVAPQVSDVGISYITGGPFWSVFVTTAWA